MFKKLTKNLSKDVKLFFKQSNPTNNPEGKKERFMTLDYLNSLSNSSSKVQQWESEIITKLQKGADPLSLKSFIEKKIQNGY